MSRQKLKRFVDLKDRSNVLEDDSSLFYKLKGNWRKDFFKN
ncbi:MAG: hypothetical protein ACJAZV_001578, partial [Roseivirga sp.]